MGAARSAIYDERLRRDARELELTGAPRRHPELEGITVAQSSPVKGNGPKPVAEFCTACKAALDAGTDPQLVAVYLGHAAAAPTVTTLRLLASLLTDATKRGQQ
jgi:hypothetical protein